MTKSAWVTAIGTTVEWFEFAIFVYLSPILSTLFFPNTEPGLALLQTYALMGVGFLARPLGAVFYGHIGDRFGRKRALVTSSALIAVAMIFTACLPTYAQVGVWAPVLLLLSRLVQGFSGGGEGSGSYISLAEQGASRGKAGSWFGFGFMLSNMGFGLALALVLMLQSWLGPETMADWGWRILFMVGAMTGLIFFIIRQGIEEGSEYMLVQQEQRLVKFPLKAAVAFHKKPMIMVALTIALASTLGYLPLIVFVTNSPWYYGLLLTLVMPLAFWWGGLSYDQPASPWRMLWVLGGLLSPLLVYLALQQHWPIVYLVIAGIYFWLSAFFVTGVIRIVPAAVRYSGVGVAYNLGIIAGGFTPALYQGLSQWLHSPVVAVAILSTVSVLSLLTLHGLSGADARRQA